MAATLISKSNGLRIAYTFQMLMSLFSRGKAKPQQRSVVQKTDQRHHTNTPYPKGISKLSSVDDILTIIYRHHIDTRCLNLSIDGGTVCIDGMVESENEKNCIEAIVSAIPGVENIRNLLQVI